ncbi:MAG TPA: alpha/beta hydrolase [Longimicrobiales bacterium]|nr:alpha/beta hydrolase [Longimicrobiales bacterium]
MKTLAIGAMAAMLATTTNDANAQTPASGYAPVNGLKMYYEIHGSGEPLVLLHGGLGAADMFTSSSLNALGKGRQLILADLQAHGRTADIDRPLRLQYMADDIAELLKYLKIPKADIMGYSMGGGVAFQTAIRHPDVVNKLIIASIGVRRDAFYPDILAQQLQVNGKIADMMKGSPMYESYMRLAPNKANFPKLLDKIGEMMAQEYNWTADVAKIQAPVLLIAADADMIMPHHIVEIFELLGGGKKDAGWDGSGRPKSQLAILPGYTHYNIFMAPMLWESAVAFLNPQTAPKW